MDYISTRGSAPTLDFRAATLAGLASDGGLYVPAKWPQMSADDIRALAGLDYVETAVRVMAPFVAGTLSEDELRGLCKAAYGRFNHGVEFFPEVEPESAQIWLRARGDLSVQEKDTLLKQVESRLLGMSEVKALYARSLALPDGQLGVAVGVTVPAL